MLVIISLKLEQCNLNHFNTSITTFKAFTKFSQNCGLKALVEIRCKDIASISQETETDPGSSVAIPKVVVIALSIFIEKTDNVQFQRHTVGCAEMSSLTRIWRKQQKIWQAVASTTSTVVAKAFQSQITTYWQSTTIFYENSYRKYHSTCTSASLQ